MIPLIGGSLSIVEDRVLSSLLEPRISSVLLLTIPLVEVRSNEMVEFTCEFVGRCWSLSLAARCNKGVAVEDEPLPTGNTDGEKVIN